MKKASRGSSLKALGCVVTVLLLLSAILVP